MMNGGSGHDVNQVKVSSLSHIRGQRHVTETLQTHLRAYFNVRATPGSSDPSFGPTLLCGPRGTGKTLTARVIHAELGNLRLILTNGEALNRRSDLYAIVIGADEHTTIFIDEAQGLNGKTQNLLLTAISERILPVSGGSAARGYAVPLKNFALVLATTHEYLLQDALRDRMRIYCRFNYYAVEDLVEIVRQRAEALNWPYESDEVLRTIAQRSKGTPRQALNRYLQTCWAMVQSHDGEIITMNDTVRAFCQLQVDELGLENIDRRYLSVLAQHGPAPLGVVSAKLGLPPGALQNMVEPYLLRENLLTKDKASMRVITEKGQRHLEMTAWPIG